jgi:hypothetical protein
MTAWSPDADLVAELDRVGLSHRKAGAADYVHAVDLEDRIWLLGPPRLRPRPTWSGTSDEAKLLFAAVPDDAGADVFWATVAAQTSTSSAAVLDAGYRQLR